MHKLKNYRLKHDPQYHINQRAAKSKKFSLKY